MEWRFPHKVFHFCKVSFTNCETVALRGHGSRHSLITGGTEGSTMQNVRCLSAKHWWA